MIKMKLNYLTESEMMMPREFVNLQAVLGIQSCKTRGSVCEILDDIREHERILIKKTSKEKELQDELSEIEGERA